MISWHGSSPRTPLAGGNDDDWVDDPGVEPMTVWHVTPRENVEAILQDGLYPGWGDDGLGVYVFTNLAAAEAYAAQGGWDGTHDPEDMVILEIEAQAHELDGIVPNPEWPNPDAYHAIMVWRADEDDPEAEHRAWRPKRLRMETEVPPGFSP